MASRNLRGIFSTIGDLRDLREVYGSVRSDRYEEPRRVRANTSTKFASGGNLLRAASQAGLNVLATTRSRDRAHDASIVRPVRDQEGKTALYPITEIYRREGRSRAVSASFRRSPKIAAESSISGTEGSNARG